MYNRRNFIKLSSLAAVGGLALGGNVNIFGQTTKDYFTIPVEAFSENVHLFKAERFETLVNTIFSASSNELAPVSMRLVEVDSRKKRNAIERSPSEGFCLIFEVSGKSRLDDMIYQISHPELGEFSMFLSTVGQSGRRYQAVFSRVYF